MKISALSYFLAAVLITQTLALVTPQVAPPKETPSTTNPFNSPALSAEATTCTGTGASRKCVPAQQKTFTYTPPRRIWSEHTNSVKRKTRLSFGDPKPGYRWIGCRGKSPGGRCLGGRQVKITDVGKRAKPKKEIPPNIPPKSIPPKM